MGALTPSKVCAEHVKDFKPINLLGDAYILLPKVLASRLKGNVGKVIPDSRNAFVEGSQCDGSG